MWEHPDLGALRRRYLFQLASVCHVAPEATWRLGLIDFALLLDGIDDHLRRLEAGG